MDDAGPNPNPAAAWSKDALAAGDLAGAELSGADLAGASMRSARLAGAALEGANLREADLSGADLAGVRASQADFTGALLEDAGFAGATLRHCDFSDAILDSANLIGADMWGARLDKADLRDAQMAGTILREASLIGADLTNADLTGAELSKALLAGAVLRGADLRQCSLSRADLTGADLAEARLSRVDLTSCPLGGIRLSGAWLEGTRLHVEQLGAGLGEELAGEFPAARRAYLALEQNFRSLGDPEASRWCYLRARRMGKRAAWGVFRQDLRRRDWRAAPVAFTRWLGDAGAEWLCDYGESVPRVMRAFVTGVVAFAAFYAATGSLVQTRPDGSVRATHDVIELLGFSFLNMCTSAVPDVGLRPATRALLYISSMQYVVGLVLIGLFGYVLGNRIRR